MASLDPVWRPVMASSFTIIPAFLVAILLSTRLYTTIRYRSARRRASSPQNPQPPPPLPYTVPFFGHAFAWLAPKPGLFWHNLFTAHSTLRQSGVGTLRLANQKLSVLFSPTAVNHMFRAPLHRHGFNKLLLTTSLGASEEDANKYQGQGGERDEQTGMTLLEYQEHVNTHYLLRPKAVNELTTEFVARFRDIVAEELPDGDDGPEVELYRWLRTRMFKASTDAFMGTKMLEMIPDLEDDFFDFDKGFLTMLFGIPRWMTPHYYNVRDSLLDRLEAWQRAMHEASWPPADLDGATEWEPHWGSRANRARQVYYDKAGMSLRGRASLDLGFMFGASSNAIPATGWMLLHLLDPRLDKAVMPRVMAELETARLPDGTVNVATLVTLPLLASIFHETLRLYVDVLVTRELDRDVTLPLEDGKNPRTTILRKGGTVVAPSWLGHRNPESWATPVPFDVFYAERFLRVDPDSGKEVFSTQGMSGKLFPFGGGKTICPGRLFAKQEVLGSLAYILLNYDLQPLGFVDESGKSTASFPSLRDGYTGSGIVVMSGDMKVKLIRRTSPSLS